MSVGNKPKEWNSLDKLVALSALLLKLHLFFNYNFIRLQYSTWSSQVPWLTWKCGSGNLTSIWSNSKGTCWEIHHSAVYEIIILIITRMMADWEVETDVWNQFAKPRNLFSLRTGTWSSHNWCYIVTQCCNTIDVTLMCPSVLHWHLIEPQLMLSIEELLEIIALQMEICLRNHNNTFSPLTRSNVESTAMSWSQNVFSKEKSCLT